MPAAARQPAPAAKKPAAAPSSLKGELVIPLGLVAAGWVDEVRAQLQEIDLKQAHIHAPLEVIEPAMKSGKVILSLNEVAAWIRPALPIPPTPKVGEMPVELPLKILAPLFMAHARSNSQKRAAVDETIPDLFGDSNGKANGSLQSQLPSSAPAASPAPARATPAAVPATAIPRFAPAAAAPAPAPKAPAPAPRPAPAAPAAAPVAPEIGIETVIGPSHKRHSAKEIVSNASRLPGVSASLLAMSDGLLVTSQAPASVKAETIAAFVPQMFGRMNQYTKELALGPLEQLTLTVESGVWHVIKSPNIYFAVLGKRGEPLPLNLLAQVAAELSSQSK
jgi:predicted regulator of Ras-like GTPase activity (Roadblock/LC7/MglB family)